MAIRNSRVTVCFLISAENSHSLFIFSIYGRLGLICLLKLSSNRVAAQQQQQQHKWIKWQSLRASPDSRSNMLRVEGKASAEENGFKLKLST